jgi:hypothetical protein
MTIKHCPDCTTGWRYVDDLPDRHLHRQSHGLVPCPTCKGQGRIIEPEQTKRQTGLFSVEREELILASG